PRARAHRAVPSLGRGADGAGLRALAPAGGAGLVPHALRARRLRGILTRAVRAGRAPRRRGSAPACHLAVYIRLLRLDVALPAGARSLVRSLCSVARTTLMVYRHP